MKSMQAEWSAMETARDTAVQQVASCLLIPRLLSDLRCLLSSLCYLPSEVYYLLSDGCCVVFAFSVYSLLAVVKCLLSVVCCLLRSSTISFLFCTLFLPAQSCIL
jgi:hypothetical protein